MDELTESQRETIDDLIFQGKFIYAIKVYRQMTESHLHHCMDVVGERRTYLMAKFPERFESESVDQ